MGLSLAGAVVLGLLGASGSGSLAAALMGAALTAGVAGLTTLAGAVRDELRDRRVPRGRIGLGIGLLLGAPVMLMLASGAAGAA
jgi:amino acid transporter